MQTISTKELIEKDLIAIWQEFNVQEFCAYNPFAPDEIKKNVLLFLGLNPSISGTPEKADKSNFRLETWDTKDHKHPYFTRLKNIASKANIEWTHMDVLFFRETHQRNVVEISRNKGMGDRFIYKQLMVSKKLIEAINPKIIVVVNNLASEFLGAYKFSKNGQQYGEWMNLPKKETSHQRIYLYQDCPIIFSKQPRWLKKDELEQQIEKALSISEKSNNQW